MDDVMESSKEGLIGNLCLLLLFMVSSVPNEIISTLAALFLLMQSGLPPIWLHFF